MKYKSILVGKMLINATFLKPEKMSRKLPKKRHLKEGQKELNIEGKSKINKL